MPIGTTGAGVAPGGWTPARLSGLWAAPIVRVMRSAGKMWQDAGRTTLASADGDPVRVFDCTFTAKRFTAPADASRATLRGSGNVWYLQADGVDDYYTTTAKVGSYACTLATAFRLQAASNYPIVMTSDFVRREMRFVFTFRQPSIVTDNGGTDTAGTALALNTQHRLIAACGASGGSTELYVDGVQAAQDASDVGSISDTESALFARINGAAACQGDGYGWVFGSSKSSVSDVAKIDTYLNALFS